MPNVINVEGFKPTSEQRVALRAFLKRLKMRSPSQATIEFFVRSLSEGFEANVTVRSVHGVFSSHQVRETLDGCLDDAQDGLEEQLMRWKVSRFTENSENGLQRVAEPS